MPFMVIDTVDTAIRYSVQVTLSWMVGYERKERTCTVIFVHNTTTNKIIWQQGPPLGFFAKTDRPINQHQFLKALASQIASGEMTGFAGYYSPDTFQEVELKGEE